MMMKRTVTAALAVLIVAAVPGVAVAQETATTERPAATADRQETAAEREARWIGNIKARALEAIEKRLVTIDNLERAIDRSDVVELSHAEQLLGELRASAAGLESLASEIRAADDLASVWALVPKIFEDYRIYAVVAPKVHLVLTADAAGAVAGRMDLAAGALGDVLDRLAENGIDVAEAEAMLAEMERLVASGAELAASVPHMVLGLTPADYPGSSETLRSAHEVLQTAGTGLRAAGHSAHEIVCFIKRVIGSGE
jgi:hypothetical protein